MSEKLLQPLLYVAGGAIICAIATPAVVALFGFTTGGVAAGSAAAAIHAGIGNVAAGSGFALMQSLGTVPLTSVAIGAITGAVGGGTIAVARGDVARAFDEIRPILIATFSGATERTRFILDQLHTTSLAAYRTSLPMIEGAIRSGSAGAEAAFKQAQREASKAYVDAMPVINAAMKGTLEATGSAFAQAQKIAIEKYAESSPAINEAIKGAGVALAATKENAAKTLAEKVPVAKAAVEGAIVAAGKSEAVAAIAQKGDEVWRMAQANIPWPKF